MTTPVRSISADLTLADTSTPQIRIDGDDVVISHLVVTDPDLAALLRNSDREDRANVVRRALGVGARGLATMGIGIDLGAIDDRVMHTLGGLTDEAERRLSAVIEQGRVAMTSQFDPEQRSSVMGKTLAEFGSWREDFLTRLDPDATDSHTTEFLARLASIVGPDGSLEKRIIAALDPATDGSALNGLATNVDARLAELRDLIMHQRGVADGAAEEASRGTIQGLVFEDELDPILRNLVAASGCVVERSGRTPGAIGSQSVVGDFVITYPDGTKVVVEAKNQASIGLAGKDGILVELDRAMANREAGFAVCVSRRDAFPAEVGLFGVYGNKVLVVDDGEGVMTSIAIRWARLAADASNSGRTPEIDIAALGERLARIKRLAETLKGSRTALTDINKSVGSLHERLGELRNDLLSEITDIERELSAT